MSVLQGISQMVSQLRSAIGSEKDRLEKDLQSAINRLVSETASDYELVFNRIMTNLQSAGEIVKSDAETIESAVGSVVAKMESAAESAFGTFKKDVDGAMTKLKGIAGDAIAGVSDATAYIRNGAYDEFDAAIAKARADFDGLKARFKDAIVSIGTDVVTKTRAGVAEVVSSAQSDIDRLRSMKDAISNDIATKFTEVKTDLAAVKDAATKDMERIVGFMKDELDKLEARVSKVAATVDRIGYIVGATALAVSVAAACVLIVDAKRSAAITEEQRKGI